MGAKRNIKFDLKLQSEGGTKRNGTKRTKLLLSNNELLRRDWNSPLRGVEDERLWSKMCS